ncbi:MAG: GGDEF domain-containing protein [Betaproteobacteria bacterium]|nr:GGDEF domain-containing protein [Betaproteobacteria bacterium]MDE2153866.1 GGDEF domain-containing protein [Betaproteobacteria bacterium]MDE2477696.1 GGDEF domain-containing protein [Betaproteobacteria bacterium]
MPPPPTSAPSPASIARAALRRLAEQGIEPTPEQYRRAYMAASPPGSLPAGAGELLQRLERSSLGLQEWAPQLRAAVSQGDWEQAVRTLWEQLETPFDPNQASGLGAAVARFVREWERSQAGLSRVQKLQALQGVEGADDALHALQLLRTTTERWAALRERPAPPPPSEAPAPAAGHGGAWKRLWLDAVRMAEQAYVEQPAIQVQARALLEDAAELQDAAAGLAVQAQGLWDACEHWHADAGASHTRMLEAVRLLLDNVAELFAPQHWIQGQVAALHGVLHEPLDPRRLEQAVHGLKDLLLRQGVLQKATDDARSLARELIDMVVRSLGTYVESSERYGERLRAGMHELEESGEAQRAKSVVQGILAQSQQMLEDTRQLRVSFAEAQEQLQQARSRARTLEAELEQLSELIQQDPLTGALNRRGLEVAFRREAARASRSGEALSLSMVDLDFFKRINDKYGHDTGDAVLRELVQVLRAELRPTDVIARIGGEEFLLLLPGEDEEGAAAAVQRAQRSFNARRFAHPQQPAGIRAHFSAGVGRWEPGEALEATYARVDKALLQAKTSGRDRVELAPPPQTQP